MAARLKYLYRKLGRIEKTFLLLVVLAAVLAYAAPTSLVELLATFAAWIAGFIVAVRLARTGVKKLIWRLRNRLIVAYAFIAMVPIVLILALVLVSTYGLTGQVAIYLINSELDRRTNILKGSAATILETPAERRSEAILRTQNFTQHFFPAIEILVRDGAEYRYPASSTIAAPPAGWKDANGIIVKDAQLYSWAVAHSGGTEVAIMAPLSREFLSNLLPGIGQVNLDFSESLGGLRSAPAGAAPAARIPPKNNSLDIQVNWGSLVPVMFWNSPGRKSDRGLLLVHTRMSAVLSTLFGNNINLGDMAYGQVIWGAFLVTVTLFLIVELVALVIGVSI
jgi:sigma-B regulation protein RsbU (phosphoserine phosphatase)